MANEVFTTAVSCIYLPANPMGGTGYAGGKNGICVGEPSLAQGATRGFLWIPTVANAPNGVPVLTPTGYVPICFDITNHRLYVYETGAWHYFDRTA